MLIDPSFEESPGPFEVMTEKRLHKCTEDGRLKKSLHRFSSDPVLVFVIK